MGVSGWVRNLPDGTVEAHLEGEPDAVREMIVRLQEGPPRARVERIEENETEESGSDGFERR